MTRKAPMHFYENTYWGWAQWRELGWKNLHSPACALSRKNARRKEERETYDYMPIDWFRWIGKVQNDCKVRSVCASWSIAKCFPLRVSSTVLRTSKTLESLVRATRGWMAGHKVGWFAERNLISCTYHLHMLRTTELKVALSFICNCFIER